MGKNQKTGFKFIQLAIILLFGFILLINLGATAADYYQMGLQNEVSKNYIKAVEYFLKALELNENYYLASFHLGISYYYLKNYSLALEYFLYSENLNHSDYELLIFTARTYYNINELDKALEYVYKIIGIKPTFLDTYYLEADIYMKKGYLPQALNIYNQILKDYPNDWKTYLLLFKFYDITDAPNIALQNLQKAITLAPNQPEVYEELILYLYKKGDYKGVLGYMEILYKLDPENLVAKTLEAKLYRINNQYEQSLSLYEELIKREPQNIDFLWALSDLYYQDKKYEQAISVLLMGLEYYKDNELFYFFLQKILAEDRMINPDLRKKVAEDLFKWGQFFYKNGYIKQGEIYVQQATVIEPANYQYRLYYIEILKMQKKLFEQYQQYLLLESYGYKEIKINREILENYLKSTLESKSGYLPSDPAFNKSKIKIGVFFYCDTDSVYDEIQIKYLQNYIYSMMGYSNKINLILIPEKIGDLESVSKKCLNNNIDLALTFKVNKLIGEIDLVFDVYNPRNLLKIYSKRIYYKGEHALFDSILFFLKEVESFIPLRAEILKVEGNYALVNLGYESGIQDKDKFLILDIQNVLLKNREFQFDYIKDNIQATAEIVQLGEKMMKIRLTKNGIYSKVLSGYSVILTPAEE